MTEKNQQARFYFANLGADVMRCVLAAEKGDDKRYTDSLTRARKTLSLLHGAGRPEAYEEGLLLYRALAYVKKEDHGVFTRNLNGLVSSMMSAQDRNSTIC